MLDIYHTGKTFSTHPIDTVAFSIRLDVYLEMSCLEYPELKIYTKGLGTSIEQINNFMVKLINNGITSTTGLSTVMMN